MKNVYLIGFMGSGKSAIAKPLARMLGCAYADSDALIERRARKSVAALFAEKGEAYFRRLERKEIARLSRHQGVVVALGGGALLDPRTRQAVAAGVVVRLDCAESELWRRVKSSIGTRPLLDGGRATLRALLKKRRAHYRSSSDFAVSTTERTPLQAARLIARRLS